MGMIVEARLSGTTAALIPPLRSTAANTRPCAASSRSARSIPTQHGYDGRTHAAFPRRRSRPFRPLPQAARFPLHELVADLVEHPPRRLVVDAKLALKVLRGDPASSASDEVHRVEPQVQGRGRLVEDRPGCWVDVVTARGAGPRLAALRGLVTLER